MKDGNLTIIADDLGLNSSVNEGIFFALERGLINGASLMANGDAFDDAVSRIKASSFKIGAHLVLVEEKSLSGIKLSKNHKTFFIKYILGLIKKTDILKEFQAQVARIESAGIKLEFINSHQHLHLLPGIMDIVISIAKDHQIPYIRIVNEPLISRGGIFRKAELVFLNFLSKMAKRKIKNNGLLCSDFFVGFINAGNLSMEDLSLARRLAKKHPHRSIELGCHPGFENAELIEKYAHWRYHWNREISLLSSLHENTLSK